MPKKPAPAPVVSSGYWLVKQEPSVYGWSDFEREGRTAWTGVRNFSARLNLRAMQEGDQALFYHSVSEKAAVGIAKVVETAYPDPTAQEGDWVCVDLVPVRALKQPVTLEMIKEVPELSEIALLKNSRLSVQPLSKAAFQRIVKLESAK